MKILIADDESGIVDLIGQALVRRGHEVQTAYDGAKALELVKTQAYDLAFLDMTMPEVTGMEIVDYIKQNGIQTKTVIITGYVFVEGDFAKASGADDYLSKPFGFEEIEAIVKKYKRA